MKETGERTEGKTNLIYFNVWIPFLSTPSLRAAVEPTQRYKFLKFDSPPSQIPLLSVGLSLPLNTSPATFFRNKAKCSVNR